MQLVYLRYNRLWSVFAPVLAELVLILYLTGLKLHFDGVGKSQGAPAAEEEEEGALINPINRGGGSVGEVCVIDDDEDQLEEEGGEGAFLIQDSGALRNPNGGTCSRGGEEIFVKDEDGAAAERGERGYNVPEFCAQPLETLPRNMESNGGCRVGDVCVKDEDQLEEEQESGGRGSIFLDSNAQALERLSINPNGGGGSDCGVNDEQDGLAEENDEKGFIVPDFSGQAVEPLSINLNGGVDGDVAVNYEEILQKDSGEGSFAVSDFSAQAALEPLLGEEGQEGRANEVRRVLMRNGTNCNIMSKQLTDKPKGHGRRGAPPCNYRLSCYKMHLKSVRLVQRSKTAESRVLRLETLPL